MARVGGHFPPAMACQQAVDYRGLDGFAELLRQRGPNRGNDHQLAGGRAGQPRFQAGDFFLLGDYRVIYAFDTSRNVTHLLAVGHRREIYRDFA